MRVEICLEERWHFAFCTLIGIRFGRVSSAVHGSTKIGLVCVMSDGRPFASAVGSEFGSRRDAFLRVER